MVGAFGVICYLGSIMSAIKNAVHSIEESNFVIVVIGCVIAYFFQGLFNIEQTNTTTIFWILFACCEAMYRQNIIKKQEN